MADWYEVPWAPRKAKKFDSLRDALLFAREKAKDGPAGSAPLISNEAGVRVGAMSKPNTVLRFALVADVDGDRDGEAALPGSGTTFTATSAPALLVTILDLLCAPAGPFSGRLCSLWVLPHWDKGGRPLCHLDGEMTPEELDSLCGEAWQAAVQVVRLYQ